MTRILHLDHSPVLGGAERSLIELARSQMSLGHDVTVAVRPPGPFHDALRAAGITVVEVRWPRGFVSASSRIGWLGAALGIPLALLAAFRLRRVIRTLRPDIVHAHTRKAQLAGSFALLGSRIPIVWHLRDYPPPPGPIRAGLRIAIRRAAHAVALSDGLGARYLAA